MIFYVRITLCPNARVLCSTIPARLTTRSLPNPGAGGAWKVPPYARVILLLVWIKFYFLVYEGLSIHTF